MATHLGPRDSRLTLLINDFKSLGSEGSGPFGFPRPIEVHQEIQELLENVKLFRDKESAESGHQSRNDVVEESSHHSQSDEDMSSDDSHLGDQQTLATQVPHRQLQDTATMKKWKLQRASNQNKLETPPNISAVKSSADLQNLPTPSVKCANEQVSLETIVERAPSIQPLCQLEKTSEEMANEIKEPDKVAALLSLLPRNNLFKPVMQPEVVSKIPVPSQKPVAGTKGGKKQAEAVEPPEVTNQRVENVIIAQESVTLVTERQEGSPRADTKSSPLAQESRKSVETTKDSEGPMTNKNFDLAFSRVSNSDRVAQTYALTYY